MAAETALLDTDRLAAVATEAFRGNRPYPWLGLEALLRPEAYRDLRLVLPALEMMRPSFGRKRAHGQLPHDRYALEYHPALPVDPLWHRLVSELRAVPYRDWLRRLFARRRFRLGFHWHYTPNGCSVSPHCDAARKLGSHIFYFNDHDDWDPAWGGQTLILDDEGRFSRRGAPAFEDFPHRYAAPSLGNHSLLFQRQGNSWHGVEPIACPEGHLRKVFIVVINADDPLSRLRRLLHRPEGQY